MDKSKGVVMLELSGEIEKNYMVNVSGASRIAHQEKVLAAELDVLSSGTHVLKGENHILLTSDF